jgi:hypothetical protein
LLTFSILDGIAPGFDSLKEDVEDDTGGPVPDAAERPKA